MTPPPTALDAAPTRWAAFRRVVTLPHVAAVFYLAFVLALSRAIAWRTGDEAWDAWFFKLALFTRQSLISGVTILLCAGAAEAVLTRARPSPPAAWGVRALAILVGTSAGAILRFAVTYAPEFTEPFWWWWFVYTCGLWWLLGCTGYVLLQLALAERAAQERLAQARLSREALAAQQMEAELSALQAQIEPHFLFNTLATVKRLYDVAPGRGRDMLTSLIAYLQSALPGMRSQRACLGDELERVRHYLAILQMRMGERLRFEIDAPATLHDAEMPPMVIATLVENSIKHGLSPLPEGGQLHISARIDTDGRLVVDVLDDGRGFVGAGGSGVGLANTRARLAALYGNEGTLSLEATQPRGVLARVSLPLRRVAPTPAAAAASSGLASEPVAVP
ncbi:MAG TPA: histidine kinase [Ideonella sp.]|uniref:sensor histidine kinase n=1 Tax=Ideonella sp. TaxID=1929293 RepID=UPI002E31A3E8|nr:histidine kinase [Ideonella sp.]HEX5683692.1 histidine kinase [Ideonella sp.]